MHSTCQVYCNFLSCAVSENDKQLLQRDRQISSKWKSLQKKYKNTWTHHSCMVASKPILKIWSFAFKSQDYYASLAKSCWELLQLLCCHWTSSTMCQNGPIIAPRCNPIRRIYNPSDLLFLNSDGNERLNCKQKFWYLTCTVTPKTCIATLAHRYTHRHDIAQTYEQITKPSQ